MATNPDMREEKVGAHIVQFHPPDLFSVHFVGDIAADELAGVGKVFKAMASGGFYVVINVGQLGSFSSAAKKAIKEVPMAKGLAIVGASKQMQLMLSLLNKVYMMVNFGKDSPITFVSSEEEAIRWVGEVRRASTAKK